MRNPRITALLLFLFILAILVSGCTTGFISHSTYDPKTGVSTKTNYSPVFFTDSIPLAEGAEFRVSVVITRRVEPISYGILSSMGGLTSEDLESKATAVVHFKNDSQQIYKINLIKFVALNQEYSIKVPEITLNPGDRFDTKTITIKVPTYDEAFNLDLLYELNGNALSQNFPMRRQTVEELNEIEKARAK